MRQLIHSDKETELCLQLGGTYRIYAKEHERFYDGDKYKDYNLVWNTEKGGAWLVRIDKQGYKHPFTSVFKMVNFGAWIIDPCLYDYEIEGPL